MSVSQMQHKIVTIIYIPDDMDSLLENTTISLSKCSLESEFAESGKENSIRSSSDFLQSFENWDW